MAFGKDRTEAEERLKSRDIREKYCDKPNQIF